MSYTLILNAGTASPINLTVESAEEAAPTEIGTVSQSFNGADRSSVRGVKRNYGSLTTFVSTTVKESITDILKHGNQLPCSGDLLGNLQTQCTVRYTGARMAQGLVDFWKVGLALNEVQPSVTLLRYSPGDTITGETFSRASSARYYDSAGAPLTALTNIKRDGNVFGVRTLLLEDARTNLLTAPSDFSNASWVKTTMTVGTGIADPTGGTSACTLTASSANGQAAQALAAGSSTARSVAVWIKRRTGSGVVAVLDAAGLAWNPVAVTASWQRFPISTGPSTSRVIGVRCVTSGDAVDVWNAQLEDGLFKSSDIVASTRAADSYSIPFTIPPGEITVYAQFVEWGTLLGSGALFGITNAGNSNPRFLVGSNGSVYGASHHNGTAIVTSSLGAGPVIGNVVEINARLFGDGSVDITQSINAGATTSGAQTAANALATAWAGALVWLNSTGTASVGSTALASFKIIAGVRSLSEMRSA